MESKLTKNELAMLLQMQDSKNPNLGKFRWVKVPFIGDIFLEWTNDVGRIKSAPQVKAIHSLADKGYLVYKSSQGMWSRFVLTDLAKQTISENA